MAKVGRSRNDDKVDAALRGSLKWGDPGRTYPLVPGINGFPLMPSVNPKPREGMRISRSKWRRDRAATTGNLAFGHEYDYVEIVDGERIDRATGLPCGYVEPSEDIRDRDWASQMACENRAENRKRMLRRQREALEIARIRAARAAHHK
jgi:hypothetical protein